MLVREVTNTALSNQHDNQNNTNEPRNDDVRRIIEVANELATHGSTSEQIAAAFILNKPEYLPDSYPVMVEAWDRLGEE